MWLGDGYCDDACRTDECLQDENDCENDNICIDDVCSGIYWVWSSLAGSRHKINHEQVCQDEWKQAVKIFPNDGYDDIDCATELDGVDYNKDGAINFHEFTQLAMDLAQQDPDATYWKDKAGQINCSACLGMEYYNI